MGILILNSSQIIQERFSPKAGNKKKKVIQKKFLIFAIKKFEMLVFKFGGASVKNAVAVKNVANIIDRFPNDKLVVVISAMDKTTNALENVVNAFWKKDKNEYNRELNRIQDFHLNILKDLETPENDEIFSKIELIFENLSKKYDKNHAANYDFEYDQIVSLGEILSTLIVENHIKKHKKSIWTDARKLIRTNHTYRDAKVDWETTEKLTNEHLIPLFENADCIITQGFIGHTAENFTTTLGREGSDFSAGILAYCLNAKSVTIWKDVPGMLNADPKFFQDTKKLNHISFKEAIELSYYGASVIHPKTIKPLQNKQIPLYVKSFVQPENEGTTIDKTMDYDHLIPSFILKPQQILFSVSPKDFSFIVEENLSHIFDLLAKLGIKINLMQNSALSFSFAVDQNNLDLQKTLASFQADYIVKYNENLELATIRHYDEETEELLTKNKEIIVEQRTRQTLRLLMKTR